MKILYAIQGTGNGHVSRAEDVVPSLKRKGEVDVLISGHHSELKTPFEIRYRLNGLGFTFGKKGGIDFFSTYKKNSLKKFNREVDELPVEDYDLVISDFEPVSAWACKRKGVPCIALSHQAAVIGDYAPRPKRRDPFGRMVLKHYAPAEKKYGFHFYPYDDRTFTPVIRQMVRQKNISNLGHITVYLPAYNEERLIKHFSRFPRVKWQIFSKHSKEASENGNIKVIPVSGDAFVESMASSSGVLCGAGFETPAEAMFMGKKLLVIPMKSQYEQHCNAAALKKMGVPVMKSLKKKHYSILQAWLEGGTSVVVDYPDHIDSVIDTVFSDWFRRKPARNYSGESFDLGQGLQISFPG